MRCYYFPRKKSRLSFTADAGLSPNISSFSAENPRILAGASLQTNARLLSYRLPLYIRCQRLLRLAISFHLSSCWILLCVASVWRRFPTACVVCLVFNYLLMVVLRVFVTLTPNATRTCQLYL